MIAIAYIIGDTLMIPHTFIAIIRYTERKHNPQMLKEGFALKLITVECVIFSETNFDELFMIS